VPKTLLAVDDSLTMRKVLEITFSGEDFRVITAEGHQDALGKLNEEPTVCVIDTALANEDGYALCKEIRKRDANATIILLSSRHNQYDQARGKEAGADDYMDKPFDTQQMIDKVRKAIVAREGGAGASATAGASAPPAQKQPPLAAAPRGAVPPIEQRGTQPSLGGAATSSRSRAATLMFGHEPTTGDLKVVGPVATEAQAPPRQQTPAPPMVEANHPPPATVAATPAALHAINGQLAGKLEGMGLTPQQADAVIALTRDVVEKAVWEVVPVIAEALIKEEIARITKGA
jgi:CheY-like chemotaxis protein